MATRYLAKILVVGLISGEMVDGARSSRNTPDPAAVQPGTLIPTGVPSSSNGPPGPASTHEEARRLAGIVAQSVDMGGGFADVNLHLDMRAFLAQLSMIPTLSQAVDNLGLKVASTLEATKVQQMGYSSQLIALIKSIESRLVQEEARAVALIQMVHQVHTHVEKVSKRLDGMGAASPGNAFGSGMPRCDTSGLRKSIDAVLNSLPRVGQQLEILNSQFNTKFGMLRNTLENGFAVLQNELSALPRVAKPGGICPVQHGPSQIDGRVLALLSDLKLALQTVPQQIVNTLSPTAGYNQKVDSQRLIEAVQQTEQQIRADISNVKQALAKNQEDLKTQFALSQKSLRSVRRVVTQTTRIVQSGVAAISSSRSLKCNNQNRKPDLDEE